MSLNEHPGDACEALPECAVCLAPYSHHAKGSLACPVPVTYRRPITETGNQLRVTDSRLSSLIVFAEKTDTRAVGLGPVMDDIGLALMELSNRRAADRITREPSEGSNV